MKQTSFPVTNIGSVSLLMTFIVLCLVTFSTLSLSGSVSEFHYSQKLAEHSTDYYNASNEATAVLMEIDGILHSAYTKDQNRYYSNARKQLEQLEHITADFSTDIPTIAYEVPVSDSQILKVTLSLNEPDRVKDGYYRITSWKETATAEWKGDDSLELFTPQEID